MAKHGYRVMDSDMHVFEPHDLYLKYMDPKWGDRVPRDQPRTRYGFHRFTTADGKPIRKTRVPPELMAANNAVNRQRDAQESIRYQYALEHGFDPASQVHAMDVEGIDVAVLFRTFPLILDEDLEPEYARDLARAWNNWITDFCRYNPSRLKAAGVIPLHDVDIAVEEARRCITELGHVGVCLTPEPHNGRHLHDPYYDPLWAELERLDAPATFHSSQTPNLENVTNRFPGHPNASVLIGVFQNMPDEMMALASMIIGGVLERFPRLRVAMLEANCAWVPWLLYRMDERWEQKGKWEKIQLSLKPSEYFLRQCFVAMDVDEYLVVDVIRRIGADNIVVSTDYPHQDSRYPHALDTLFETFDREGIDSEARRKILWDNCARLYKLSAEERGASGRVATETSPAGT
jgi:predicted TIM-barrel fold metal-dependent hydrolase